MGYDITALFVCLDEFSRFFEEWEKHRLINTGKKRYRACKMSLNEMLTIMVLFHLSLCKNFKYFNTFHIAHFHKMDFPTLLNYGCFVQLMPRLFIPLCILLQSLFGEETRIYIAGASSLPVCHNKRISRNRILRALQRVERRPWVGLWAKASSCYQS